MLISIVIKLIYLICGLLF